jgi:ankyrin repeat protein
LQPYIIKSTKRSKAKRFEYLFEQLRAQAKAKYGNLSTDELDFKLCKIVSSYSLSQKEMYKAIKLVLSGANVNAQDDKSGHNILHLAAKYGNAEGVIKSVGGY